MARRRRTRRRAQQGKHGLTLNTGMLLAYLSFVFIFVIAIWISQQASYGQIRLQQRTAADVISRSVAFQLSKVVASYTHSLESMTKDPALIELLRTGDEATIQQRSAELYKAFPYALALRMFKVGTARLDDSVKPKLSYAFLDLISSVDRGNTKPPVEVHLPNTADQHLVIVRPVLSGKRIVGYIQLALDIKAVQIWAHTVVGKNYIELIQVAGEQKPILLTRGGNDDLKTNEVRYYKVEGTRWQVSVWSESSLPILPLPLDVIFVLLFSVLIVGVVLFFLKRSVSNTVKMDAANITQMAINTGRGVQQHDYQLYMPEFSEAARRIKDIQAPGSSKSIDRERDDDPNAISFGNSSSSDLSTIDPLYMSSDTLSVEELDESQVSAYRQSAQQATKPDVSTPKAVFNARDVESQDSLVASQASHSVASVRQPAPNMPPPEIFKAYDIRGIVGSTLTPKHATLIGRAIGSEAIDRGITQMAFARDGRLSGPELGQAFVTGVQSTGVDVLDVGMVPTPVLYFAATENAGGSGVMLTGSHNPPDYNGFKMMLGGETLSGDQIQALRERIETSQFHSGSGKYANKGVGKAYLERIVSDVKLKRPLNVVIDCGNGVAGAIAPLLFKSMGCRVTELYCDVDGKFPNHHPDPSKPENLKDLIAAVKSKQADVGLAFDGDGDRVGVIDSEGNIIYPDRLMMLFAADVLKRNPGAQIIYDIKCSNNLTKVIWEKGGEPVMWKTGHSLIKAKMKQSGAALAGEMSGHIFFSERWYGFDDGMYSGARLLEILSQINQSSVDIFAALPDAVNTPELNVAMAEGEHHKFIDNMMMQADFGSANVTMIDGIRVDYEDGWGLVRASNTTPVLVLRFEGKSQAVMERIQQAFKAQMLAVKPDLRLPF